MTNVVVITGRLCADPESRQTQSGTAVCHFRLAVGRNRKVDIRTAEAGAKLERIPKGEDV